MRKRKKVERIKKPKTFVQHLLWEIQQGYIKEDGTPLKCQCGCRKLKECNYDYIDFWGGMSVGEYDVKCKSCGRTVGHWAYGNWQL